MGFRTIITEIANGAVSQAVLWVGDFSQPVLLIMGLGMALIALGAIVSWVR